MLVSEGPRNPTFLTVVASEAPGMLLSWNGQAYFQKRRWRRTVMYASTLGLLWVAFSLFYCLGGAFFRMLLPSLSRNLAPVFYLTIVWLVCTLFSVPNIPLFMAMAYWVAGVSFSPFLLNSSRMRHILILACNGVVITAFHTKLYPILVILILLKRNASWPTMYDLHPCSFLLSFPLYLCLCTFGGIALSTAIPAVMAPYFLAPSRWFPDQFSETTASLALTTSTLGVVWVSLGSRV